jgi:glycine cleavage system regulatory protein
MGKIDTLVAAVGMRYVTPLAEKEPRAMVSLILTIIGPDRPGLVRTLSEAVALRGGNWLESRMARLGGQFAGIVRVEAPEALLDDLPALEREGLRVSGLVEPGVGAELSSGPRLMLEVVGNDRPGIVHDIARVLAAQGVNIEELSTGVASGSFSGEMLFRTEIILRSPNDAALEAVRAGLERLGNEMMVDIRPIEP